MVRQARSGPRRGAGCPLPTPALMSSPPRGGSQELSTAESLLIGEGGEAPRKPRAARSRHGAGGGPAPQPRALKLRGFRGYFLLHEKLREYGRRVRRSAERAAFQRVWASEQGAQAGATILEENPPVHKEPWTRISTCSSKCNSTKNKNANSPTTGD